MQRARRLGVALAVVGTLLVVAWWLAGDRGSPGGAVPEPIARGSTRVAPEAPVGGLPSSPERGAPASATASEASRLDPPDGSVVVSCRVRFQGTDRGPKQFQFRFAAEEQTEGSIGFIEGADGVAEARFPGPGRYKLFDLRTDGVEQRDIEPIVDVTQGGELALDVAEPKSLVLVVRAAETLSPLREAQAWVLSETESRDYLSRNAIGRVSSPAAGPFNADIDGCILLPPSLGTHVNVAVRSPGTAWSNLRLSLELERVPVDLSPGGNVRLRIENWTQLEHARVYSAPLDPPESAEIGEPQPVVDKDSDDAVDAIGEVLVEGDAPEGEAWEPVPSPGEDGTVLLEGLPCGARRFDVRRGEWWKHGEFYGHATCRVVAGETVELAVLTKPPVPTRTVDVNGEVLVPEEWGPLDDVYLVSVEGSEPVTSVVDLYLRSERAKGSRVLPFTAGPVPTGGYRIVINELGWMAEFVVAEGMSPPRWTLPAPGTLRIRIVDAETRSPVRSPSLAARSGTGAHVFSRSNDRSAETGECLVRVPPGTWEISCSSKEYEDAKLRVEVPGPVEVLRTVALHRGARVEVQVRLDGKTWTGSVEFEIERGEQDVFMPTAPADLNGEEVHSRLLSRSTTKEGGIHAFEGIPPGTWDVRVGNIEGFEDVAPKTVTLERGAKLEVVFELQRKK